MNDAFEGVKGVIAVILFNVIIVIPIVHQIWLTTDTTFIMPDIWSAQILYTLFYIIAWIVVIGILAIVDFFLSAIVFIMIEDI